MELLWFIGEGANEKLQLDAADLSQLVKIGFQELLYKVQVRQQERSAGGLAAQPEPSPEMLGVWEASVNRGC